MKNTRRDTELGVIAYDLGSNTHGWPREKVVGSNPVTLAEIDQQSKLRLVTTQRLRPSLGLVAIAITAKNHQCFPPSLILK